MWIPTAWFAFPSLPLTNSIIFGKLLTSLGLSFLSSNNSTQIIRLLCDCNKIMFIKYLEMGLVHKNTVNKIVIQQMFIDDTYIKYLI